MADDLPDTEPAAPIPIRLHRTASGSHALDANDALRALEIDALRARVSALEAQVSRIIGGRYSERGEP